MLKRAWPCLLLIVAGCYDRPVAENFGSTTPQIRQPAEARSTLDQAETPVRIGELGRNFAACNAQGAVNARTAAEGIVVRAAPFDQAHESGRLAADATFFICTRSLDQRWMGVVYSASGRADPACGVSAPVASRRDYDGPCQAGWVPSAQVRMTSGVAASPGQPSQNSGQSK